MVTKMVQQYRFKIEKKMSRDCCVALPRGAMSVSAVFVIVVFPDHTHYF